MELRTDTWRANTCSKPARSRTPRRQPMSLAIAVRHMKISHGPQGCIEYRCFPGIGIESGMCQKHYSPVSFRRMRFRQFNVLRLRIGADVEYR